VAFPACRAVPRAVPLAPPSAHEIRLRDRGRGADAARASIRISRAARASARRRARHRAGCAVRSDPHQSPDKGKPCSRGKDRDMDRPLRLIPADPLDKLARTVEALLVVSSTPLSVEEVSVAAEDDPERVEAALRLVADRFA